MKRLIKHNSRSLAMTLIEMLVVIAIIAILASILLPVIAHVKQKALITRAKKEMKDIEIAVQNFQADYSVMPLSTSARASSGTQDFTYGTYNLGYSGGNYIANPSGYQTNNSELVAILTDDTTILPYINTDHRYNPKQKQYLQPTRASSDGAPGAGPTDLVYRDPWKNPYIVTLDADYDKLVKDPLYRLNAVSQQPSGTVGYNSLISSSGSFTNDFVFRGQVMVWSFGPDGMATNTVPANEGVNKDNIFTW